MPAADLGPHSLEAEEHILGAMMLAERACDVVLEILEPAGEEKFFRASHGLVYRALRGLRVTKRPVDPISVMTLLENKSVLAEAGGKERIREIATLVPAAGNAGHHAKIVLDAWKRRRVIESLAAALELARAEVNPEAALQLAERSTSDLRSVLERGQKSASWSGYEASEYLDDLVKNPPDKSDTIPGPWPFVERMERGDLYILGGFSADGKTALGGQFGWAAGVAGKKVGYVTMEMSREQVAIRFASMLGARASDFRTGFHPEANRAALGTAIAKLATWNIDILDDAGIDVPGLSRYVNRAAVDLLIVDHLHQFRIHNPQFERAELEQILTDLKQLARRANIPILLLCQLTRAGDAKRPFPRPTMSSLKGTGKIEQLASVVWFVWRKRDDKQIAMDESEFITAKNRHGHTGVKDVLFDSTRVRFIEAARIPFSG